MSVRIRNSSECELCGITTYNIKKHKKEHFIEKLQCRYCEVTFKHKPSLCRHEVQKHKAIIGKVGSYNKIYKYPKKDPFPCTYCDVQLGTKHALIQHTMTHTGEKPFKCDHCGKDFRQSGILKNHIRYMHERDNLQYMKCNICDKTFLGKRLLQSHMKTHKKEKATESCDKCTYIGPYLKSHYRKTHENQKVCDINCKKTFRDDIHLRAHRVFFHDLKDSCPECDKKCSNAKTLVHHMEQCHSSKTYKCDICYKEFKQNRMYLRHKLMHREKSFTCKFCEKTFSQNITKNAHEKRHIVGFKPKKSTQNSNNKSLACRVCPKMFSSESILSNHEQNHKKEYFECKICMARFPSQGRLHKHSDVHKTIFSFKCKYCGKGSKQCGTHKRHEQICFTRKLNNVTSKEALLMKNIRDVNIEVNRFVVKDGELWRCTQCDKTGKQRIQITLHAEQHVSGLSFPCLLCDETFKTRRQLSTHKRSIHNQFKFKRGADNKKIIEWNGDES